MIFKINNNSLNKPENKHFLTAGVSFYNTAFSESNSVRLYTVNFVHGANVKRNYTLIGLDWIGLIGWDRCPFLPPEGTLVETATAGKFCTRSSGKNW